MGAARFPEQIVQRAEEGLRAIEEDRRVDPEIDKLRAKPGKRTITPEEIHHRGMSASAEKSRLTVTKRLIMQGQLKAIRNRLAKLKRNDKTKAEIEELTRQANRLRKMLPAQAPSKKRPKRSRKARPKKPARR